MIEDVILKLWLEKNEGNYERLGFNVPLWLDPPSADRIDKRGRLPFENQPEHRIDVIASRGTDITLIEVKGSANVTAIGQLITYINLWGQTYYGWTSVSGMIVARYIPKQIRWVCGRLDIKCEQVDAEAVRLGIDAGIGVESEPEDKRSVVVRGELLSDWGMKDTPPSRESGNGSTGKG